MAFLTCNFYSKKLDMDSDLNIILPYGKGQTDKKNGKFPVLYLLHGLSDDHTTWCRMTSIERYVSELNIAVIMPNVHRSFYLNTSDGRKYFDYVNEEVPAFCEELFNISDKREDKFVAGLSMGGYGAMKLALSSPYQFNAVGAFSGALDFEDIVLKHTVGTEGELELFRKELKEENDLFRLAEKAKDNMPSIYQVCGTEDFLYDHNIKFRDFIKDKCSDYKYEEGPGTHEWGFWDTYVQKFIDFIVLRNSKIGKSSL